VLGKPSRDIAALADVDPALAGQDVAGGDRKPPEPRGLAELTQRERQDRQAGGVVGELADAGDMATGPVDDGGCGGQSCLGEQRHG
jgi:hypothetical protein